MAKTLVVFFQEKDGSVPVLDWLNQIPRKAQNKCIVRIERLEELGYKLRRPEADYLGDDIYELRMRLRKVNYRILYSFHDQVAVLLGGLTKESKISSKDIKVAISRLQVFQEDPEAHTYKE